MATPTPVGSFSDLLSRAGGILVGGIGRAVDGELAQHYSVNDNRPRTVDQDGDPVLAGQVQATGAVNTLKKLPPWAWALIAVGGAGLLYAATK